MEFYPADRAEKYRAEGYWTGDTFPAMIRQSVHNNARRLACIAPTKTGQWYELSYDELYTYARQCISLYKSAGLKPGDRVIIHFPNIIEGMGALVGAYLAGLIPIHSLFNHSAHTLARCIDKGEARAIITIPRFLLTDIAAKAHEACALSENTQTQIIMIPEPDTNLAVTKETQIRVSPDSLALIQLSGGTTGEPKLIGRTHDDYLYSVRRSAEICELTAEDIMLMVLPMTHNFSQSSPGILGMIYAGGCTILGIDPSPRGIAQLVHKHNATIMPLVPPLLMKLLEAAQPQLTEQLRSLRYIQVGGAKLAPSVASTILPTLGIGIQQVFGMAEGLVCYTRLNDTEETITTTQGKPMSPGDEIRILDEEGHPVHPGQSGYLWTRGPYTITRYLNGEGAEKFKDGWYCPGDIVRQSPTGELIVEGRDDDRINRGGEKISPDEVENQLLKLEGVRDVAVVGIPDDTLGEKIVAILHSDQEYQLQEVLAFLSAAGLATYQLPDMVVSKNHFPTTAVGKNSKKELRKALSNEL